MVDSSDLRDYKLYSWISCPQLVVFHQLTSDFYLLIEMPLIIHESFNSTKLGIGRLFQQHKTPSHAVSPLNSILKAMDSFDSQMIPYKWSTDLILPWMPVILLILLLNKTVLPILMEIWILLAQLVYPLLQRLLIGLLPLLLSLLITELPTIIFLSSTLVA